MKSPTLVIIFWAINLVQMVNCIYPKTCKTTNECGLDEVCNESWCICDIQEGFQHDSDTEKCVKLAGRKCRDEEGTEVLDCIQHGHCSEISQDCVCNEGYDRTKFDECKQSYGTACTKSEECNVSAFLICDKVKKVCGCTDPVNMIYDNDRETCVSKLSGDCEFTEYMNMRKDCIRNSHCVKTDGDHSDFIGICECKTGFTNISSILCLKLYQESCDEHSDCVTGYCGNAGKCACRPDTVIDNDFQTCLVNVGEICHRGQLSLPCTRNATCSTVTSRCECLDRFSLRNGLCEPSVETTSTTSLFSATDASHSIFKTNTLPLLTFVASISLLFT